MFDKRINTIYVDMDGVIADFDKYIYDRTGEHYDDDAKTWEFVLKVPHFYYKLDPTPYFDQLWDSIIRVGANVEMLIALPRVTPIPEAKQDKLDWVTTYINKDVKVNFGPFSRDKWRHCKPGDVLIDDKPSNIAEWSDVGGFGFLHNYTNHVPTLSFLEELRVNG